MANSRATPVWWRGWTAENDRRPLWLPVALGAGACLYFALPSEPAIALGWAALAAAGALALLAAWLWRARAVLALAAALVLGFGADKLREADAAAPVLQQPVTLHLTARIAAVEAGDAGLRLLLTDPISGGFPEGGVPERLRVTVRVPADFTPGEWVSLTARLSPPSPPAMPGAADFARAAWFESVGGSGFSFGLPSPALPPRQATVVERVGDGIAALRWRMTKHIRDALPGSEGAVAASLITGMRGGIAPDDVTALRDAGLAHVLSISGLHMVLMGMGLFWIVRALLALSPWLALHYPIKKWAAVIVALTARGPDLLVGGDAATVALRAADGRLYFVGAPKERFAGREWLRRGGDVRQVEDMPGIGKCDGLGCVVRTQAGLVVLSRRPDGLAEDCARAAILISAASAKCAGPRLVIDGARAAHDQGTAIRFTPELKIETVRGWRGERPWVR